MSVQRGGDEGRKRSSRRAATTGRADGAWHCAPRSVNLHFTYLSSIVLRRSSESRRELERERAHKRHDSHLRRSTRARLSSYSAARAAGLAQKGREEDEECNAGLRRAAENGAASSTASERMRGTRKKGSCADAAQNPPLARPTLMKSTLEAREKRKRAPRAVPSEREARAHRPARRRLCERA